MLHEVKNVHMLGSVLLAVLVNMLSESRHSDVMPQPFHPVRSDWLARRHRLISSSACATEAHKSVRQQPLGETKDGGECRRRRRAQQVTRSRLWRRAHAHALDRNIDRSTRRLAPSTYAYVIMVRSAQCALGVRKLSARAHARTATHARRQNGAVCEKLYC